MQEIMPPLSSSNPIAFDVVSHTAYATLNIDLYLISAWLNTPMLATFKELPMQQTTSPYSCIISIISRVAKNNRNNKFAFINGRTVWYVPLRIVLLQYEITPSKIYLLEYNQWKVALVMEHYPRVEDADECSQFPEEVSPWNEDGINVRERGK